MPIPGGARYRVKTTKTGKKVRLAFQDGEVVEAKNIKTGATHTPAEFAEDKRRRKKGDREKEAAGTRPADPGYVSQVETPEGSSMMGDMQSCCDRVGKHYGR